MRIGIATDHAGFDLKEELIKQLHVAGHEVVDFGAHNLSEADDYPDYVLPLAQAVAFQEVERGVAICGSGVGASVCANKILGSRGVNSRPFFRKAGRRGRSHEHSLYGWQDRRTSRRPGTSSRRSSPPTLAKLSDTCSAWAKWLS